jgi:hypothetical protein
VALTAEQLLSELEDLIRNQPPTGTVRHNTPENRTWIARTVAAISHWDMASGAQARSHARAIHHVMAREAGDGIDGLFGLLHEARSSLRLSTIGPVSTAIGHGQVFDYFDEIRKLIAEAGTDLLIVDPYMDADFASRYLQDIRDGVALRLLGRERLSSLLPAIQALVQQNKSNIVVRTSPNFHDRYIFVDGNACYQSGASFKDGAKNAPTTITQITDAFSAVQSTYEAMWTDGKQRFLMKVKPNILGRIR